MIEQALEVQKEVNLCFINCTEAFDRVQHDEININTVEDRWERSLSDQKHVLGTDSSNAG